MMKIDLEKHTFDYGKVVSNPSASENGRSFTLLNNSKYCVRRWSIDKEVFKDRKEERCDFLIEVQKNKNTYYWIELKGKDLTKACSQMLNTLKLVDTTNAVVQEARIITSGTNKIDIRTIEYQRLNRLMSETGGRLRQYTNQGTETI